MAWYNKGVTLGNLGMYKKAIECFDKAIEMTPLVKINIPYPYYSFYVYNEVIDTDKLNAYAWL